MQMLGRSTQIVGFVSDLMFGVKIEIAATNLGYNVIWFNELATRQKGITDNDEVFNQDDYYYQPETMLIDRITDHQPVLLIFDLSNTKIPWKEWIEWLKSSPATRRIPILCFGSHQDHHSLRDARVAGADVVVARSKFSSDLPDLIQKFADIPDYLAIRDTCQLPLLKDALEGIALFNRCEFFEAHELLERAWNQDLTVGRELYRAILQISVAYLQVQRKNYRGAVKMFLRSRQWINPLPDECRGVNIAQLREDASSVFQMVIKSGPEGIGYIDASVFKPINLNINHSTKQVG
jgi:hypothetical protein